MTKKELRKTFNLKRASLTPPEKNKADDLILIHFQQLALPQVQFVFSYAAMADRGEISTDAILDYLEFSQPGLHVAYPVCEPANFEMQAHLVDPATLFYVNQLGIPEPDSTAILRPQDVDLALIPLLCFDAKGYRVGYGKGVYDKFLAKTRPGCIKIGLSYFEAVSHISDVNEFDVPLNFCVTPERIYEFKHGHQAKT